MSKQKKHSPTFKAKVELATLCGEKTITELSSEHGVHQTLVHRWVKQLKDSAVGMFSGDIKRKRPNRRKNSMRCTPKSASSQCNEIF